MDFKDKRCQVCGVPFDDNDDIVVCPECGTPQHRSCYERLGKCVNSDKHGEDFCWGENSDVSICTHCGAENPKDAMFCVSCARPLGDDDSKDNTQSQRTAPPFGGTAPQGVPFGFGGFDTSNIYANYGISMDEELSPGVTAQECESYVKTNAFYYLPVFKNFKRFGKGRFNLSSALFTGAWYLYRKLYAAGAVFIAIIAACLTTEAFFINDFLRTYSDIQQTLGTAATSVQIVDYAFNNLSALELWKFILPCLANLVMFVTMFVSGLVGNRIYYKHTAKHIKKIKDAKPVNLKEALANAGGVNTIAAVVVMVCYFAFNFIIQIV
ncbi:MULTISPECIES: RING finger protein [unclassified Ruminococcus]|uniref:RING finger protein n=1 Tax=unclassified Ruminococcus TaxID=2608920 RepID=UPI00210AC8D5|nr:MULTISPECIES: RING finger protein [unclassified Ruminococcus]